MALTAPIYTEFDERSAAASMARAERVVSEGARDMSRVFSNQLSDGMRDGSRALDRFAQDAQQAYRKAGEAAEELERQERSLQDMRDRGASNTDVRIQSERVAAARRDEARATREAAAAIDDYEDRARGAGDSFMAGLRGSAGDVRSVGGDMASEFASGFGASSALLRLGAAGGPIGLALAGVAALGVATGKLLADNIAAGLAQMQMEDLFQSRLGVDDTTMARYGEQAADAYTSMFGASIADNLRAAQFGVQGGVIGGDATDAEIQQAIEHLQTLAQVMEVDVQEAARASGQLIRGGFARDGEQAADIIVSGFQNGLDIAGDWLDTITEYSTQFRKLGLDGQDAIGLISQGLQGAARDSDVVADSLKEFSIRAVDGSELTAQGFAAIGFQADEMATRFLAGGDSARSAFGATLNAIRSLDDPIQQALTWQALFGTQWEDMGDAINSMDLSTARTEFGTTEGAIDSATTQLGQHVNEWERLGRTWDTQFGKLKKWLADSEIGKLFNGTVPDLLNNLLTGEPISTQAGEIGPAVVPGWTPESGAPMPAGPALDINTPAGVNPLLDEARRKLGLAPGQAAPAVGPSAGTGQTAGAPGGVPAPAPVPGAPGAPSTPPQGAPGAPIPGAPVPGERTPILTDTQKKAEEEAKKAAGGGALPPAPVLPLQYRPTAGLDSGVASAMNRQDEVAHQIAEKQARLNQLEAGNVGSAEDIQKAKNDLAKAENDRLKADQALVDAQLRAANQQTKQLGSMSSDIDELGAKLDTDFGMSKGLGGVVENFVKAAGNILAAPFLRALGLISEANPNEGSGLIGIAAANGAFGAQYTPGAIAASRGGAAGGGYGAPSYGLSAANPNLASMMALAQTSSGKVDYAPASDLVNGLADCSGSISDLVEMLQTGQTSPSRLFTTTNFASDEEAAKLGFRPGYMPGALNVGVNPYPGQSGHMAATLPNGVNFEGGGGTGGGAQYGGGAAGALDPQFEKHYYMPVGAAAPSVAPAAVPGGSTVSADLPIVPPAMSSADLNANPGLTNPGLTGGGAPSLPAGGGGAGMNSLIPGMAGPPRALPTGGLPGAPGAGAAVSSGMPSQGMGATGGGGAQGLSGSTMGALSAAASGLDMLAPGSGAAAQIGLQLANRGIAQLGKVGGIAASGVLETLSLSKSPLANPANNWIGKIATGVSGASMALPNQAGKLMSPEMQAQQAGGQGGPQHVGDIDKSTTIQVDATNRDNGQGIANDIVTQQMAMNTGPGH